MEDREKPREDLVAEIAFLRQEFEEMRNREKPDPEPHALTEGGFWKTLVSEVPEYLYSIEFNEGKLSTTFHSPRCVEITGYAPGDYAKNPHLWIEMIYEKDRERVLEFIRNLKEPLSCKSIEHRIIHKDGSLRWVVNMTTVHLDTHGSVMRQSGFIIDVTGRREEEERNQLMLSESRRNSLFDDLTGLYNRRGFRELAEQQLRVATRINQPVLLFFIDVDRFKQTNDTFGHRAGDELLIDLAEILKNTFRESDLIARIGGDEFTALTMETGADSDEQFIERLQTNIDKKNRESDNALTLSVTVGVSRFTLRDSDSIAGLMERADKDMYEKKKATMV
ncbi:MAG: sensor domain-containing diguanylate cyclase [Chitinispirillaceae bacterium]|nr:sensor domain-containing diguanylate cyclase [Chitinispirillaceae bacterium]